MGLVIGICGGSGSGKTTLAELVVEKLGPERAIGLAFDSYYRDQGHLAPEERAKVNYDHPDSLDGPLIAEHLTALAEGKEAAVPVYDFSTHCRTTDVDIIEPRPVIVVEGILLLAYPELRDCLHLSVFRECPEDIRFDRRVARDVAERGRTPESVAEQFAATVKPMHDDFVEPTSMYADIVVPYAEDLYDARERVTEAIEHHALRVSHD